MEPLTVIDRENGRRFKYWDGRTTMRTLADALAKLHELGSLAHDGQAEISTMLMRLPNGELSAVVAVMGTPRESEWRIAMPSSAHFDATETRGERRRHEISKLNGAISDAHGNVELLDGSHVHNVELRPTRLAYELTAIQRQILHHAICFLKAEDRCYRHLHERLLAGWRVLDYGRVAELGKEAGPSLKAIERYVAQQLPSVSPPDHCNRAGQCGSPPPAIGPARRLIQRTSVAIFAP